MELLNEKNLIDVLSKGPHRGASSKFLNKIKEVKITQGLLLLKREWKLKIHPSSALSYICLRQKGRQLYGRKFKSLTVKDKAGLPYGWLFIREK